METPLDVKGLELQAASTVIDSAPELRLSRSIEIVSGIPGMPYSRIGGRTFFPALTIPVENKPGYECPPDEIEALEKCLPQVAKLLIVGWRAAENPFLKTLAHSLGNVRG